MRLRCCSFEELAKKVKTENRNIVMFGAGVIGQISIPQIMLRYGIVNSVISYLDNDCSKWGHHVELFGKNVPVKSPDFLNSCSGDTIILLNISRYSEVIAQLGAMMCTGNMDCYITPMMLIHSFCSSISCGYPLLTEQPTIPKIIHYMWLGKSEIPQKLHKCIESWKLFCPDYEIVEWNEDNYDFKKHTYMKDAYKAGAYGFVPDYARLDILYNYGGFYMDTDVEIKKSLDKLRYQEAFCGVEKWQVINFGGLSGAVPGHPMIKKFLDAREGIEFVDADGNWNKNTCGFYDTRVAINEGYEINGVVQNVNGMNIYPYDYFHPYDYMSGILNETVNTYSIHWFNGGWLDEKMKEVNAVSRMKYMELYNTATNNL